ncbi:MAG: hypothetical protein AB7G12_02300 [Thermoanaerobaculia bacterium]
MNLSSTRQVPFVLAATLVVILAFPVVASASDSFLKSDDYKDGEEVVKVFLMDDDYARMIDDVERNDVDFDWAWVKTPNGKMKDKVKQLGFDLSGARTISIPQVRKFAKGMVPAAVLTAVRDNLAQGFSEMGLETVASGGDLTFEAVLVDYKKDSTQVLFAMIQPFIELEGRLTDNRSKDVWLVVRDQVHGDDAETAAFNFADNLTRFLK